MTLRWRFALVLAVAATAVTAIAGIGALWNTSRALTRETDRFLAERIAAIPSGVVDQIAGLGSSDRPARLPGIDRESPFRGRDGRQSVFSPDVLVQVVDEDGRSIVAIERSPRLVIPGELVGAAGVGFATAVDSDAVYRVATVPTSAGGSLVLARDITENSAILIELRRRIILLGLALAGAAAAAGWFIAGRTIEPIRLLNEAAHHVAATQDLSAPIPIDRQDEVGQLAMSFNTMLGALQESKQSQHRLVMDASHELRTPLTSLRTNIEVLQRAQDMVPSDRAALLADVDLELRELTGLVEELVNLATDRGSEEPLTRSNLGDVVDSVLERARRRTGRPIHLDADDSPVTIRVGQVERAVANLLDNADKWSPPGAPIEVSVRLGNVVVRDHGPGIPEGDLPHIFDRFYRADTARSLPGSGLGLAIVAQIARSHGGDVDAANRPGGGAEVAMSLPIDP